VGPWKPLEIMGDNSLADSAIGFLQGKNVSRSSFLDFIRFWDAYVIYDSFHVEKLPQRDVHISRAEFLDSHPEVKGFLVDLEYTPSETDERWEFAKDLLTEPHYVRFLSRHGLPESLARLRGDEDSALNYLKARYPYSKDEVKQEVFDAVANAILKDQASPETSELSLLLPHLIRSHMNIYSQTKRGIEARYITIREVLVDQTRQYANNLGLFGNPRPLTQDIDTRIPEEATAAREMMTELENRLRRLSALSHPVYLALDAVSSAGGTKEDLITQLQTMRETLNPFRQNLARSLTEPTKLIEINAMLREFESEFGKTNHKFRRVRKWLSTVPLFTLTVGALTILTHLNPSEAVATGVTEDMAYKIYEEVRRTLRERKYGFSAFKEVFRGPVRLGPGTDEAEAYKLARQIILG